MADYKKIDLQIGTEEQFEEKKLSLPIGTLVGITDPIHESELDTDLQTKINEVSDKLTKPTNPSAESAVTMLADGTVGTKPLTSITGKSEVAVQSTAPTGTEVLWIDPNGTSGSGSSGGGGKLYRHIISFDFEIEGVSINADIINTSNSLISKSDFKSYIISPIVCAVSGGGEGAARLQYSTVVNKYTVTGALLSKDPAHPKETYNIDISKRDIDYFTDTVTEV